MTANLEQLYGSERTAYVCRGKVRILIRQLPHVSVVTATLLSAYVSDDSGDDVNLHRGGFAPQKFPITYVILSRDTNCILIY